MSQHLTSRGVWLLNVKENSKLGSSSSRQNFQEVIIAWRNSRREDYIYVDMMMMTRAPRIDNNDDEVLQVFLHFSRNKKGNVLS
jgi:hypothetical protein